MQAWDEFLRLQENELGADIVRKWLRPLKIVHFDAGNLYLQANDSYQINWFEEHVRKKAQAVLRTNNRRPIKVHIAIIHNEETAKKRSKKSKEPLKPPPSPQFTIAFDELDSLCTFENFNPGNSNQLPFKLLCKTTGYDAESKKILPRKTELGNFNPIYLCGPSGVGKTHLLMATANVLRQQGLSVIYARTETFTEHVVTAIRAGEMNLFRQSYRTIDVLILDDVHVLARKSATQEEVFHTFNSLHVAGKQIILSANCSPGELHEIEPRLISRFEWGIVVPMVQPSTEEMRTILQTKAASLNCTVRPQIVEFLLETFKSSCKAVVRALEALILRSHLNESSVSISSPQLTLPLARKYLADLMIEEQETAINPEKIIHFVTEFYGMRSEDILGKAQTRDCVLPRQMAMYFCRMQLKMPYIHIGELFGKDHSTVMSSVKLIQAALDANDQDITSAYNAILKKLRP